MLINATAWKKLQNSQSQKTTCFIHGFHIEEKSRIAIGPLVIDCCFLEVGLWRRVVREKCKVNANGYKVSFLDDKML